MSTTTNETQDRTVSESHGIGTTWSIISREDAAWSYDVWVSSGPVNHLHDENLSWLEASNVVAKEIQAEIDAESAPKTDKDGPSKLEENAVEAIKTGYRGLREAVYELLTGPDNELRRAEAIGKAIGYHCMLEALLPGRSVPSFYLASIKRLRKDGRIPATVRLDRLVEILAMAGVDSREVVYDLLKVGATA